MNFQQIFFNRVKKTFEKIVSPTAQNAGQSDFLVKMNLPPLMGRRDAAYDRAGELIAEDLFSRDEEFRGRSYRQLLVLFDSAIRDTRSILITLSSPDTESREHQLLTLLTALRSAAESLTRLISDQHGLLSGSPASSSLLYKSQQPEQFDRDERLLNECEINLVHRIRRHFSYANAKIVRYREYTGKSFSKAYADRYRRAFEEYSRYYRASVVE